MYLVYKVKFGCIYITRLTLKKQNHLKGGDIMFKFREVRHHLNDPQKKEAPAPLTEEQKAKLERAKQQLRDLMGDRK